MRVVVWEKDDCFYHTFEAKRFEMDPAVVKLPYSVPIIKGYYTMSDPIGVVKHLRLEDGEIVGELFAFDEEAEVLTTAPERFRVSGFYGDLEFKDESQNEVASCYLVSAVLVSRSSVPGEDE